MLVEKIGKDEKRIRSIWLDTSLIVKKDSGQGLFSCCAGLSVVRPNWCWSGTYITEEAVWYLSGYHQYNSLAISLSSFLFLLFFLSLSKKKRKKNDSSSYPSSVLLTWLSEGAFPFHCIQDAQPPTRMGCRHWRWASSCNSNLFPPLSLSPG